LLRKRYGVTGPKSAFAHHAWEHIARSSCLSIDKARRRLGYEPRYASLEAMQEAVSALIDSGEVNAPKNS